MRLHISLEIINFLTYTTSRIYEIFLNFEHSNKASAIGSQI